MTTITDIEDYPDEETFDYWWVSWYTTAAKHEIECGWPWWVSDYSETPGGEELDLLICVAAVNLETEEEVWEYIRGSHDNPDDFYEQRFAQQTRNGLLANKSGRWPVGSWSKWPDCAPTPTRRATLEEKND